MNGMNTDPAHLRPRVLFVGHDAGSPQIAAGLLRRAAGDRVEVDTAHTQDPDTGGRSDEMLVAMGLDPAAQNRLSSTALHTADRVIILGADLDVARLPGPQYEEWVLLDDLTERVEALGSELTPAAPPSPLLDRLVGSLGLRSILQRRSRQAVR
jgi:hypothetical protein